MDERTKLDGKDGPGRRLFLVLAYCGFCLVSLLSPLFFLPLIVIVIGLVEATAAPATSSTDRVWNASSVGDNHEDF